jgi:curli biogenesis system outer membrane secretion channel CsgG
MKKYFAHFISLAVFVMILGTSLVSEAAIKTVAVGNFIDGTHSRYGKMICEQLQSSIQNGLVQNKNYTVVERSNLDQIFRELGLQNSGVVNSSSAIEIGNLSGADYTLMGKVVEAEINPYNNLAYEGLKAKVAVSVQIVDNETGQVLSSDMVSDTDSSATKNNLKKFIKSDLVPGHMSVNRDSLIYNAAEKVANKVLERMNKINPLVGMVVAVKPNEDTVTFDLGYEDGVKEGDIYTIYAEAEPIVHPVTGEILGVDEKYVGTVKVEEVRNNLSIAKIKDCEVTPMVKDKVKRG